MQPVPHPGLLPGPQPPPGGVPGPVAQPRWEIAPAAAGVQHEQDALQRGPLIHPRPPTRTLRRRSGGSSGSIRSHSRSSTSRCCFVVGTTGEDRRSRTQDHVPTRSVLRPGFIDVTEVGGQRAALQRDQLRRAGRASGRPWPWCAGGDARRPSRPAAARPSPARPSPSAGGHNLAEVVAPLAHRVDPSENADPQRAARQLLDPPARPRTASWSRPGHGAMLAVPAPRLEPRSGVEICYCHVLAGQRVGRVGLEPTT